MAFALTVSLDVTDRPAVVIGGGPEAVARVQALLAAGARVTLVAPRPDPRLEALADEGQLTAARRNYQPGDLAGVFIAYVTREDPTDLAAAWSEAEAGGVLLSTLDDVDRCHFATPSIIRRGDLAITVATGGRAPALAKRLRKLLESQLGPEIGELVDVLAEARALALPRSVPFGEWAARWEAALDDLDGLLELIRTERRDDARNRVLDALGVDVEVGS